jgi:lantibiotic modifying enzyme
VLVLVLEVEFYQLDSSPQPVSPSMQRRDLLKQSAAASALVWAPSRLFASFERSSQLQDRPWLAAALKTERWLAATAQQDGKGIKWAADPTRPAAISTDLYNGMAGIVLFYLELHNATGDQQALSMARGGADYLLASVPDEPGNAPMGLYTGLAGTAIVLDYVRVATGDARYEQGVRRILSLIAKGARRNGLGVEWNDSTDIISGSAGIGLTLLALRDRTREVFLPDLVTQAADRLIERSQLVDPMSRTWLISPQTPRNYPNFSHGTAGVSFFLARAGGAKIHRDAALAGERWLQSIMTETPNGGRMIYHSAPGNEQIFYLSWCHGPAGTARLYRGLAAVTRDPSWDTRVNQLAVAIRDMKVPERSPGFWNNISQCCGNCGVSEFFVSMYRRTGDMRHLEFAETVAHDTLARATTDGNGIKWIQAEHRVRPELLVAQTGLMQGAAGVGLSMLHLDGARVGRKPFVRLPDDPF